MRAQLATVATSNEEPFTRRQALALGYSPKAIDHSVQTGRWIALRRGVYIVAEHLDACADDPARRHALDVAAAMLALRTGDAAGSHHSAAVM